MSAFLQYIIAACVLILSAFVAFYLFIAFLVIGAAVLAYMYIRRWMLQREIIQPGDAGETSSPESFTVIEGQFERVEAKEPPAQKGPEA